MKELFIGLMSGTSLDGVDAVLAEFNEQTWTQAVAHTFIPYPTDIKEKILSLQTIQLDELNKINQLSNTLSLIYAEAVNALLHENQLISSQIRAIGCHGQTIRHAPEQGFSIQIGNLALLAELTQINVVGDFRSRDVAAGGQGAPLVPAFHQSVFAGAEERAILNIGGIANLSILPVSKPSFGFDTGPGNMLMDAWVHKNWKKDFDTDGLLAKQGAILSSLTQSLLLEPFFSLPPPKSTGRDLFNLVWLTKYLDGTENPYDVLATLLNVTSLGITNALMQYAPNTKNVYICGGGTNNPQLIKSIKKNLPTMGIKSTQELGLPTQWVEAAAFAWLAQCFATKQPGNLPHATGAKGARILGAWYPA